MSLATKKTHVTIVKVYETRNKCERHSRNGLIVFITAESDVPMQFLVCFVISRTLRAERTRFGPHIFPQNLLFSF